MYVYIRSEPQLYTVGFYRPDGEWESESDHGTSAEAAARVRFLNGGNDGRDSERLAWCLKYGHAKRLGVTEDFEYIPLTLEMIDRAVSGERT